MADILELSAEVRKCIEMASMCHYTCVEGMIYSARKGCSDEAKYASPDHLRLMTDCADICKACSDIVSRGADYASLICGPCADICEKCAGSCEQFDDAKLKECANLCRQCAEVCKQMATAPASI
jgi:hypothetical protein